MSLNIVSEWADKQATQEFLDGNEPLKRFAYEFCTKFNVFVSRGSSNSSRMSVVSSEGLPLGEISVEDSYNKNHERVKVYVYRSDHITKRTSAGHVGRGGRASEKIKSLLAVLSKNKEIPTWGQLVEGFKNGVAYAFLQTRGQLPDFPRLNAEAAEYLCKHYLTPEQAGTDQNMHNAIIEVVKAHEEKVKAALEADASHSRFAKGCTLIGVPNRDNHYLVGKVRLTKPVDGNRVGTGELTKNMEITGIRRLGSLHEDAALGGQAVILKEYFRGKFGEEGNELGIHRTDKYFPEVDVACGYSGDSPYTWVLIPDTPPQ